MDRARAQGGRDRSSSSAIPGSTERLLTLSQFAYPARGQSADRRWRSSRASRPPDRGDAAEPRQGARGRSSACSASRITSSAPSAARARSAIPRSTRCSPTNEAELRAKSAGNAAIGDPWREIDGAVAALRAIDAQRRFSRPSGDLMSYALTPGPRRRGARQARRRPPARLFRQRAAACSRSRLLDAKPVYPVARAAADGMVAARRRANISAPTMPRRGCCSARNRPRAWPRGWSTGTRLGRRRGAQGAVGRRRGGDRRLDRPDDRLCPPIDANDRRLQKLYDEQVDGPLTAARAKLADARFAAFGDSDLSRRDRHAAHHLRQGRRLDREWRARPIIAPAGPAPTTAPRARRRSRSRPRSSPTRRARPPGHARLHLCRGHHRRQFGIAGDRPRRATSSAPISTATCPACATIMPMI